jgi:hypothetical protein
MSQVSVGSDLKDTVPEGEDDILNDHETKGHLNTLMDAHHIMSDPDKMKRVHALAGRHSEALSGIKSVNDLKAVYNSKYGLGHLQSGSPQENDLAGQGNNGVGNTGNKGQGGKEAGHEKGGMRQESQLGDGEKQNGTGKTGNKVGDRQLPSAGFNKSGKKQQNDEKYGNIKNGTGNDGN